MKRRPKNLHEFPLGTPRQHQAQVERIIAEIDAHNGFDNMVTRRHGRMVWVDIGNGTALARVRQGDSVNRKTVRLTDTGVVEMMKARQRKVFEAISAAGFTASITDATGMIIVHDVSLVAAPATPTALRLVEALFQTRHVREEVGDGLEVLARMRARNEPPWLLKLKVASIVGWIVCNAVREWVSAFRGQRRPK